jgi:hypothetical protein
MVAGRAARRARSTQPPRRAPRVAQTGLYHFLAKGLKRSTTPRILRPVEPPGARVAHDARASRGAAFHAQSATEAKNNSTRSWAHWIEHSQHLFSSSLPTSSPRFAVCWRFTPLSPAVSLDRAFWNSARRACTTFYRQTVINTLHLFPGPLASFFPTSPCTAAPEPPGALDTGSGSQTRAAQQPTGTSKTR